MRLKFRLSFTMITILIMCLFIGCQYPQDYTKLMELPRDERKETFEGLPLEKQVDFYLIRALHSHPSDTSFAESIAKRGETVIPYLLERLHSEKKDYNKQFLIRIFEEIHFLTVDLRKRQDVIEPLEDSIKQITNSREKEEAQSSLEFIKTHVPRYAPDYDPTRIRKSSAAPPR